jgi:hypothetical protein
MTPGIRTYSTAKGYVQSAFAMMANPDRLQLRDDTTFFLSFHLLCGFATELYLKSFLLHRGVPDSTLRSAKLRHDLVALLQLATEHGFSDDGGRRLASYMGKWHKSFEYRYLQEASEFGAPTNLKILFGWFSSLDVYVDHEVGASVSKGLTPGGAWIFPEDRAAWRL